MQALERTLAERVGGAPVIEVCLLLVKLPTQLFKVDPCEANFPGFENLEEDLKGWQWTFAKSPKFTLISGAQEVHLFHLHLTVSPDYLMSQSPDPVDAPGSSGCWEGGCYKACAAKGGA